MQQSFDLPLLPLVRATQADDTERGCERFRDLNVSVRGILPNNWLTPVSKESCAFSDRGEPYADQS